MIQVGQKIDDFAFDAYHNDEIKQMKLSDHKGKWLVLLFYPADFTFVCPTELEDAAEHYADFQEAGDEDVFRKLRSELDASVSDAAIRDKMRECLQAAVASVSK